MPSATASGAILASEADYERKAAAALAITRQRGRRDEAIARLRRENERLDVLVAQSVSAQPESPAWYLSSGC